ncbi:MAG: MBL fold metallo-hydrolase, partial [Methylobacterium sp.]|nr:MBL fold metallo-hydrolase [Methylobacterium sp.]
MRIAFCLGLVTALLGVIPAKADEACLGPIARLAPRAPDGTPILPAALQSGELRLTYVGHATFTIETPGGVTAATDYNDYVRPEAPPDVATMNHAHSTHFTHAPDPAIRHVLRGWGRAGEMPKHDLQERDLRVRNVPTNIRGGWGEARTEFYGNSIFIFEAAGLCIAHLGHL